jgi:chromosome segregation ATPase
MSRLWPIPLAFAAGLAVGLLFYMQSRGEAQKAAVSLASGKTELDALRARLDAAEKKLIETAAPPTPDSDEPGAPRAAPRPSVLPADDAVTRAELVRMLDEKNQKIASTEAALGELREKLLTAEARAAELVEQQERSVAELAETRERLDAATRLTQALQAEAQSRNTRVSQIEEGNRDLRRRAEAAEQKIARLATLRSEIEEVARQRESYITEILRRYREATDQFRAFTLRVDASTDPGNPGGTYLSRIQSAVAQADEDLRQLRTLNTRAAQLQKQLESLR